MSGVVGGRAVVAQAVGVGLVASAVGAARALAAYRPRAVVLLGSYGLFPGRTGELLELASVSHVQLVDGHVFDGRAAIPDPMPTHLALDSSLAAALACVAGRLPEVTMATTLAITTDDQLAMRLAQLCECRGENLEAFSVAHACDREGVPMVALLGATNWVGSQGRAQWQKHHALVAKRTAEAVLQWLEGGIAGL